MSEPTDDEIEAAARALHAHDRTAWTANIDPRSFDVLLLGQQTALRADARAAIAAALPLVEARLRDQIAGEIEAEYARIAARATLGSGRIVAAICIGLLRARRVVRGEP